jgi:hypothetical protein
MMNVYLEQECLNDIKDSKKGSENWNSKIAGENNVPNFFMLKV